MIDYKPIYLFRKAFNASSLYHAYWTPPSGWLFLRAGRVAIALALLVAGFQAMKAALADPVKSMQSE